MSDAPLHADFLVIGGGLAGLSFALQVAQFGTVVVLAKGAEDESNTAWAQGGIAAVWADGDTLDDHVQDTLEAGAQLGDAEVVRSILQDGPPAVRRLIDWGVRFTREGEPGTSEDGATLDGLAAPGDYHLTREGGHSARRILHAGDITGAEIQRALLAQVRAHPRIRILTQHMAIDLITERKVARHIAKKRLAVMGPEVEHRYGPAGPEAWMPDRRDRCLGAYVLDVKQQRVVAVNASVTLLATGGAGKVYRYTSNPDAATGDGMAMAYRAGGVLANMEFVQFHPTCLYHPREKNFLVSEALRGEGGVLRLPDGTDFMRGVHPMASLAPRDVVAREIDAQIKRRGLECVYLDLTEKDPEFLRHRFPGIHGRLLALGIDMCREPIPVVPAAHYFCGGVKVDLQGRTRIDALLAAGEVTCTGLHGANRLASNSLLEAAVFGERAARAAIAELDAARSAPRPEAPPWDHGEARDPDELVVVAAMWDEIRRLMWNYVGIVRTDRRLLRALRRIELIEDEIQQYYWNFKVTKELLELRNLACVAGLVVRSALGRRESRGLHYSLDCPRADDTGWLRESILRREW